MGLLETFGLVKRADYQELAEKLTALDRAQAIIEFDTQGNILSANDNFLQLTGYQLDELIGRHHNLLVSQEDANTQAYHDFWRDLGLGRRVDSEFKRFKKNGEQIWIQGSYVPLLDDTGKAYKIIKYAVDITEKKYQSQRERALQLCQANVMLIDNDNAVIYMNNAMTTMLRGNERELKTVLHDFDVDYLVGKNIDVFLSDRSGQQNLIAIQDQAYGFEHTVGKLIFDVTATPWYGASGKRIGTLIEWFDKSERVAREQAERESSQENERIRKALDVCDTPVMTTDKHMNIIYLNSACQQMLRDRHLQMQQALPNFAPDALIGKNIEVFNLGLSSVVGSTSAYRTSLEVSGLTFQLIATPVRNELNDFIGLAVEWDDVTDQLSEQQRKSKELEENTRIRQALDNVSTNVVITDNRADVIYSNQAASDLMKVAKRDVHRKISEIDKGLKTTYRADTEIAGRSLAVVANPVLQDGTRVGSVYEWRDLTEEKLIQKEIDNMIDAANVGDFSVNIKSAGKSGFFLDLSNGLNNLVGTVEVAINDVVRMLGAVAKGDLSERVTRDYQGAFGQLKDDANLTAEKLTEVVSKIRLSTHSISTSANDIVSGNGNLSSRTESQAASLEETAASMEEMTSAVKQSADNAIRADELVVDAQTLAQEGGTVVEKAVTAMAAINQSSRKISDIISVIDEIAFQTNLLALNAAVEAARAGDQGRGFAVVAGEVRNLAQRSAGAAKEIKDLISDSVAKVADGTELVNRSGAVLQEIVGAVNNVTVRVREISAAAKEQSSGIEQVNAAITQMDEVTQQNAALVAEATASGQTMLEQTQAMSDVVKFFSGTDDFAARPLQQTSSSHAPSQQSAPFVESALDIPEAPVGTLDYENTAPVVSSDDEWEEF